MRASATADAKSLAGLLRNPLVVFGLVLLAGDGPLVVAYAQTTDPLGATVLRWATIAFIFGMAAFFCYLVAFRPRNLYAPDQIPEAVIEKALYHEPTAGKDILREAQELVGSLKASKNDAQREVIASNINLRLGIANEVQTAYELLLIPGYDVSIIAEMLDSIAQSGKVSREAIAKRRNITPTTLEVILTSMEGRQLVEKRQGKYILTDSGVRLMESLRQYLLSPENPYIPARVGR